MSKQIGIRREDKNEWERRVPLTPEQVRCLIAKGIPFTVQSSAIRVFTDAEYAAVGAHVGDDLSECPVILAVKEIPAGLLEPNKTYVFFSHVIKGQPHNMPMLKRVLELGCTIIDYEKITDEKHRRLIFFSRYAGIAGMVESLWALGKRLAWEGISNPFETIKHAYEYDGLEDIMMTLGQIGEGIRADGYPRVLAPLVVGFAGYGNASTGAQEALDSFGITEQVSPVDLPTYASAGGVSNRSIGKVVFHEEHMVERIADKGPCATSTFDLQHYYNHPEEYKSVVPQYLDHLTILINGIFWTERYPRIFTIANARRLFANGQPKLHVIGDISCDIGGAVEITRKATHPGAPVFVYNVATGEITDGVEGNGPVVMAVDNLPCELSREASQDFGQALKAFIPAISGAAYTAPFEELVLPPGIKRAVIAYHGELTPQYRYLKKSLDVINERC